MAPFRNLLWEDPRPLPRCTVPPALFDLSKILPSRSSIGFLVSLLALPPLPNWVLQSRQDARQEPEPPPLSFCSSRLLDALGASGGKGGSTIRAASTGRLGYVVHMQAHAPMIPSIAKMDELQFCTFSIGRHLNRPCRHSMSHGPRGFCLWVCCSVAMLPLTTIVRTSIKHSRNVVPSACVSCGASSFYPELLTIIPHRPRFFIGSRDRCSMVSSMYLFSPLSSLLWLRLLWVTLLVNPTQSSTNSRRLNAAFYQTPLYDWQPLRQPRGARVL